MMSDDQKVQRAEKDKVVIIKGNLHAEWGFKEKMFELDFQPVVLSPPSFGVTAWTHGTAAEPGWAYFLEEGVPQLRKEGWQIRIDANFP